MVGQEKVYETLAVLEIEFEYTEHPAAPTIEIARQYGKIWIVRIVRICFSGITKGIAIIW